MKKPRVPTPEELELWHESNRHTARHSKLDAVAPRIKNAESPKPTAAKPRPQRTTRPLPPLEPLSTREASRQLKTHGRAAATLDLHGYTKLAAHEMLQQFLARAQHSGHRHVAIITGKGRGGEVGVLRQNLPHWLNEPALRPLISAFAYAPPEKGGAGVVHVLVKRPR